MNAIMNKNSADVKDCTMYVGLFPCNECAKIIIQSGIKKVVYVSDKKADNKKTKAAKRIFAEARIECR
jgi:dCMP deaminase